MGRKRNRYIGGGAGALGSGAWSLYSSLTTVKDLPDDAGWLARMIADPPVYAPWLLFGVCLIFLAWVFWHRQDADDDQSVDTNQSTTGPNSPNIGTAQNVHINYAPPPPAPTQEQKDPYRYRSPPSRMWTEDSLNGLHRAVTGYSPAPDIPLKGILGRVYKSLGGMPKEKQSRDDFIRRVDLSISDAIVENGLSVWGRLFDRPRERISMATIRKGRLKHIWQYLEVPSDTVRPLRYTDLMFNKQEILEVWPDE